MRIFKSRTASPFYFYIIKALIAVAVLATVMSFRNYKASFNAAPQSARVASAAPHGFGITASFVNAFMSQSNTLAAASMPQQASIAVSNATSRTKICN